MHLPKMIWVSSISKVQLNALYQQIEEYRKHWANISCLILIYSDSICMKVSEISILIIFDGFIDVTCWTIYGTVHFVNMLRKYNSEITAPDFKYSDIKYSFFECWSFTCRKQVLYLVIFDRITAHLEMNLEGNNFIKHCKYPLEYI